MCRQRDNNTNESNSITSDGNHGMDAMVSDNGGDSFDITIEDTIGVGVCVVTVLVSLLLLEGVSVDDGIRAVVDDADDQ